MEAERTRAQYEKMLPLLQEVQENLERITRDALKSVPHVDRVVFRVKELSSFLSKAALTTADGVRKYVDPVTEIEDVVAGRVQVFFRRDIDVVTSVLLETFTKVEQVDKRPVSPSTFEYESKHLVMQIPPQISLPAWTKLDERPRTFELQVRTLFMHAWAEPQHDFNYKNRDKLEDQTKRRLAWAASNAWGADEIFEQVLVDLES